MQPRFVQITGTNEGSSPLMTGHRYWRSLEELSGTPQFRQFVQREFPEQASEMLDSGSRRKFMQLMAASLGLAGLTACRRPVEKILPLAKGAEDQIPGNPLHYSTAITIGTSVLGLLVETHDGRPTKIEGNPRHPASLGATNAFAQASILGLYDPDRSQSVLLDGRRSDWDEFKKFSAVHFASLGSGGGLRILTGAVNSPSLETLRAALHEKFPQARWIEYEPAGDAQVLDGLSLAFGEPLRPSYNLEKADVILSLESDFLGLDATELRTTREFARRRKAGSMNRLYVAENSYSITGATADHRLRMRASSIIEFAAGLARELGAFGPALKVLNPAEKSKKWLQAVAKDLAAHKGRSLVVAGPRQPAEVHAAVAAINQALGNTGATVSYIKARPHSSLAALRELSSDLASGKVSTLLMLGSNPAYNAPADLNFSENLKKAGVSIHLGLEVDETAALSKWHLPEAHYLEVWSDARAADGTVSVQQPLIEPLFGGKSAAEVVALVAGYKYQRAYEIVRNQYPNLNDKAWRQALHDGIVAMPAPAPVKAALDAKKVEAALAASGRRVEGMEIAFRADSSVWDGRFANNGWLQEAPDPISKLVWDNAALLSAATAKSLGVVDGDVLSLSRGGRQIAVPAMVQPGHADNSITLLLGYGRRRAGRVGRGVGADVYPLRATDSMWFTGGVDVKKSGRKHQLVTTQEHHSLEGRPIVREAAIEEFQKHPEVIREPDSHYPELFSLYGEHSYDKGNQWGMVVDLNACIGCNACLLACQAENNIPIVGKEQVGRGREMHWIRLDRYFTGEAEDPQVVYQPMACQQCENAPCENVCPVAATSHSPEGLNDMAYNRCVGTRYCANNCPYKVRRFNFLEWHKDMEEVQKMVHNPDVTVRMRGVMEKCTYCVQRIQETKIRVKAEARAKGEAPRLIRDGDVMTACQQACPAEAIVFGNINDPESRVAKLKQEDKRNYAVLGELNIKPRTSYLAKLRNPNPELA